MGSNFIPSVPESPVPEEPATGGMFNQSNKMIRTRTYVADNDLQKEIIVDEDSFMEHQN